MNTYKHWRLETDADNIAWLTFDKAGATANTLGPDTMGEFASILDELAQQKLRGLIIKSGKKSGFIAGANIEEFTKFTSAAEAIEFTRHGQLLFDKLEQLPYPTVAMINGFCVGGGLELALACRYRVVDDSPKTKLGLPEVLLGIHPGWGGSIRLPRLIGAPQALDLILTGRTVTGKAAAKLGFADTAVPLRQLERTARFYIMTQPARRKASCLQDMTNKPVARPILAKMVRRKLAKKASPEHYPAPYALLDNWQKYGVDDNAYLPEAESLGTLISGSTAQNLVRVFFLQDRLKGQAKGVEFTPKHVHVIGAGTMGGDIAAWAALRGFSVTLQDREAKFIAPAIKRAYSLYKAKLKNPILAQEVMDRLMPDPTGKGVAKADVIIEAIYENLEAKQALFKTLEQQAKPDAILATNTSGIPLDEINTVLNNPGRLVGIHFFNPVAKMQLVEVVKGKQTEQSVIDKAMVFVRKLDKLPLLVKSSPGFLVNRVLMPYLIEATAILNEGVPAQAIDKAALAFGMPMGPITLADAVGLDVCLSVADNLTKHYGGEVPEMLRAVVKAGNYGMKSGKGFYEYKNGKKVKQKSDTASGLSQQVIADRLILRMINEAVACMREQITQDQDLIDAGMIFGTGFAPFRGGPMHYTHAVGAQQMQERLQDLQKQFGDRFKPDAGWAALNK